jgi:hypothetical protein
MKTFWRGWRTEFNPKNFFSLHDWLFFTVAWPVMMEAVEVIAMYVNPIYPKPLLRDMGWSWTNPWAIFCPRLGPSTTDFSHDYCYGTNMGHFGGPYSILWYWLMYLLSLGGQFYPAVNDLTVFVLINLLIMWRLRRKFPGYTSISLVNTLYAWIALLFFIAWPQILLPLFFTAGSILFKNRWVRLSLLILAPLIRFPIGGPLYLWVFISRFSVQVPGNYFPYSLTIVFWMLAFVMLKHDWKASTLL